MATFDLRATDEHILRLAVGKATVAHLAAYNGLVTPAMLNADIMNLKDKNGRSVATLLFEKHLLPDEFVSLVPEECRNLECGESELEESLKRCNSLDTACSLLATGLKFDFLVAERWLERNHKDIKESVMEAYSRDFYESPAKGSNVSTSEGLVVTKDYLMEGDLLFYIMAGKTKAKDLENILDLDLLSRKDATGKTAAYIGSQSKCLPTKFAREFEVLSLRNDDGSTVAHSLVFENNLQSLSDAVMKLTDSAGMTVAHLYATWNNDLPKDFITKENLLLKTNAGVSLAQTAIDAGIKLTNELIDDPDIRRLCLVSLIQKRMVDKVSAEELEDPAVLEMAAVRCLIEPTEDLLKRKTSDGYIAHIVAYAGYIPENCSADILGLKDDKGNTVAHIVAKNEHISNLDALYELRNEKNESGETVGSILLEKKPIGMPKDILFELEIDQIKTSVRNVEHARQMLYKGSGPEKSAAELYLIERIGKKATEMLVKEARNREIGLIR